MRNYSRLVSSLAESLRQLNQTASPLLAQADPTTGIVAGLNCGPLMHQLDRAWRAGCSDSLGEWQTMALLNLALLLGCWLLLITGLCAASMLVREQEVLV